MTTMPRARLGLLALAVLIPACGGGGGGGGGGPAPTAFTIVQRVPAANATGVVRTSNLYIRLNRAPNVATVTAANVILALGGVPVGRAITYDAVQRLITINPTPTLGQDGVPVDYTVSITAGLLASDGVPMTPETYTITTSAATDVTLPAFATPNFTFTGRTTGDITLDWDPATDASSLSYEVFILPPSGSFDPTETPAATGAPSTANIASLVSDTTYEFRLRARDGAGNLSAELHALSVKTLTSFLQDVFNEIISVRCVKCHAPGGQEIVPFFMNTPTDAYNNLVDDDAVCALGPVNPPAGTKRVLSGGGVPARDASFMYQKIVGPDCGDRMPRDGNVVPEGYLTVPQITTIGDWITEGALNN